MKLGPLVPTSSGWRPASLSAGNCWRRLRCSASVWTACSETFRQQRNALGLTMQEEEIARPTRGPECGCWSKRRGRDEATSASNTSTAGLCEWRFSTTAARMRLSWRSGREGWQRQCHRAASEAHAPIISAGVSASPADTSLRAGYPPSGQALS